MATTPIERVHRPTPEQLFREYQRPGRAVLITGLTDGWPSRRWTPESLQARFSDLELPYETWDSESVVEDPVEFLTRTQKRCQTTLGKFVDSMRACDGRRKLYCVAFSIFDAVPQLSPETPSLEPYMGLPRWAPSSLRRRMQVTPYFWMGPRGSLSPLHFDRADNFHAVLYGSKRWSIFPPEQSDAVYYPSPHLGDHVIHFSPVDVDHPDFTRFPEYRSAKPIEVVMEPGDVLYLPAGWWHHVRSLEDSIALNFFYWRGASTILALNFYWRELLRRGVRRRLRALRRE